ncbi:MAG: hypothetical protein FWC91_05150 [Defluviitaleaceae bacterium]|nr:hypothetical protein [Defluviitaleaceae bacterium]
MHNLKNRKRLIGLVITFMLVFATGSAFAFTPGIIDIAGTVNITAPDNLYVVWENVVAGPDFEFMPIVPAGFEVGAIHSAGIVSERGRTAQRIEWEMTFFEEGFAAITASVRNHSFHPVIITGANAEWVNTALSGVSAADFGLMVDLSTGGFVNTVLPPNETTQMTAMVMWDGTIPAGFTFPTGGEDAFAASLAITFDYAPAS